MRLDEARKHSAQAKKMDEEGFSKAEVKAEKRLYSEVKGARWILLAGRDSLSEEKSAALMKILDDHADLSLCHAMKEEMSRLFDLRDALEARTGWEAWFEGAKASGIPALVRFAELKEKRIDGLVAHASHPISTGRLEGTGLWPMHLIPYLQASWKVSTTGLKLPRELGTDTGMKTTSSL